MNHSGPRSSSRDLALVAVFVGVMVALGLVPAFYAFGAAVPITAQSMGPMLAGGIIGARRGFLAMLVFIVLVAVGLPLLSGGRGGLEVFAGSSAGFVVGFPVAAYVVGRLTERGGAPYSLRWGLPANVVGGIGALYLLGIPGMSLLGRMPVDAAATAMWLFVPGDLAKAVVAALVARGVHAGYPGLLPARRRDAQQPTSV